jgi:uncharacterized coiled-coil DUF342 family protein
MIDPNDHPRWNDDRLDRLADAVDGLRQQQQATNTNIQALREQQEATNTNIDTLVGVASGHQERFAVVVEEIRDMKAEIKGLQTENRRILDHLFRQEDSDRG